MKESNKSKKLAEFRELCEKQLCKYWDSPQDLASKVSRSLTQLIKRELAVGWIRADQVNNQHREELVELKQENITLREELSNLSTTSAKTSSLASGTEIVGIEFFY